MTPSSQPFHQLIWIDHHIARLFAVMRDGLTELAVIRATDEGRGHVHHKAGSVGPGHVDLPIDFLREAAAALQGAEEVLIVGPGDAKHQLKRHLTVSSPLLARSVIGVEPMGKCDNGDLQAFANLFFRQADRMRPLRP